VFYLRAMPKLSARANSKKPLKAKYKRIVLKLSGEALKASGSQDNISPEIVQQVCRQIQEVHGMGVEVAVVIGGGNIWRGLSAHHRGMERTTADYMGMLATVINGLALQSALEQMGLPTRVQTAIKNGQRRRTFHPPPRHRSTGESATSSSSSRAREIPFSRPTRPPPSARTKSARRSS
jgi:hypothetical protein